MAENDLYSICVGCGGTGKNIGASNAGNPEIDCPNCSGTGFVLLGELSGFDELASDITKCLRRLKKIMDKLDIGDE